MKLQADLDEWIICNPGHREDRLPQPYALVAEILGETVMHQLGLAMFEIEQKKKDSNYEGSIREYCCQNTIEIPNVACISSQANQHNHLLAGDRKGCLFLLDLAKKVVFSKKELFPSRRVISISESLLTDGDQTFTTAAVVLNSHPNVYVLRYRHGEQKLQLTQEVIVAPDSSHPGKLPYTCEWADYSRLLLVYTYDGSILMYRIPELVLDIDAINRTQTIPLEEEEFKKKLRYPLSYAQLETEVVLVS